MTPANAEIIWKLKLLKNDFNMNNIDNKISLIEKADANAIEWVKEQLYARGIFTSLEPIMFMITENSLKEILDAQSVQHNIRENAKNVHYNAHSPQTPIGQSSLSTTSEKVTTSEDTSNSPSDDEIINKHGATPGARDVISIVIQEARRGYVKVEDVLKLWSSNLFVFKERIKALAEVGK